MNNSHIPLADVECGGRATKQRWICCHNFCSGRNLLKFAVSVTDRLPLFKSLKIAERKGGNVFLKMFYITRSHISLQKVAIRGNTPFSAEARVLYTSIAALVGIHAYSSHACVYIQST